MKISCLAPVLLMSALLALAADNPLAPPPPGATSIAVKNEHADKLVTLTADKLAALPHVKLTAGKSKQEFSGVPLSEILPLADVAWSKTCSQMLTCYVLAEGADGYQVLFSVPEIDPQLRHKMVILADRCDGKPLPDEEGPYELVEEGAKQYGRWVKQVKSISLRYDSRFPPEAPPENGPTGKVYLVGMGPGDADLVTFKAAKALKNADRVFCFSYLKDEVARYAAEKKITVASPSLMGRVNGRNPADLSPEMRKELEQGQADLKRFTANVRSLVAAGNSVVFADAGDPSIYCPWSWITDEFADLQPVVVPGLSSFNAANAALKQSITRNVGSVLISAGEELGTSDKNGRLRETLVFFTHRAKLKEIAPRLLARYPADTPVAVVCEASYPTERVVWATLGTVLEKTSQPLPHLYLVYVGEGLKAPAATAAEKHE